MSHQSAFIITSITTPFPAEPSHHQLKSAAAEAGQAAMNAATSMDQQSSNDPNPETIAIGSNQYRFIQGNLMTNSETFADTPAGPHPQQTFEIWSEARGQMANPRDTPQEILEGCWNHADNLVKIAIESHLKPRPLYPKILITPNGTVLHQLKYHDQDVFDDPSPGGTANLFVPGDPIMAWHRSKAPLQDLEQAKFRIEYLRTLAAYPNHIVVALDWNT